MTSPARKIARSPLRRTACNRAALAALGLFAIASGSAQAAAPGVVLNPGTVPVIRGVVSQKAGGYTYNVGTSATIDSSPIKVNGVATADQVLTITQLLPKIILDWNSFDLANGSVVHFVQPSSTAAVLNRIHDLNPSTIEGKITANGQVYLVNQNGILFNRGTQIDVGALFASTLDIKDDVFQKGVTSGGVGGLSSSNGIFPAFAGGYDGTSAPQGTIVIGAGGQAQAAAPRINAAVGGAVVIIAPMIDNRSGVITSPDGQVILAAGNAAYLGFSDTNNPGFRGMLVEVTAPAGQDVNLSSYVRNGGTITSDRGNVTLAGLAINQEGRVSASSAMLTNGSIYLQARTLSNARYGAVTLAAGSVTETPLDTTDTTTMHQGDDWTPYRPVVKVDGARIDVEGSIASPSGAVSLNAVDTVNKADARIYLGAGSTIDASGAWSTADDSANLLTFKVTSNELANSPDQKDGILHGATVTVDLRGTSTLLDLSGYQANQARTLVQKATQGGLVSFTTTGDLIERNDATVDVSGGGVHYTGVTESTTKLLGADGKLYDIMSAPEQMSFAKVADKYVDTQARWGFTRTYDNLLMGASLKRPDYAEGAAGGSLQITMNGGAANGLVLDGANLGGVTVGSQQLASAPRGGSITLGFFDPNKTSQTIGIADVTFMPGTVTSLAAGFGADSVLSVDRKGLTLVSTDLFSGFQPGAGDTSVTTGFSTVNINADGRVTVPENVTLAGPIGGAFNVQANQVEVDGHISVPSGSVTLANVAVAGSATSPVTSSSIAVNQGAGIDTRGTWTNNYLTGKAATMPTGVLNAAGVAKAAINGGAITLDGVDVDVAEGSVLDVSAGGSVSTKGTPTGGDAGAIALSASDTVAAHSLTLDGTLRGEGFANGGSLSVATASTVQIGGTASASTGLQLDASMFTSGGFGSYSVSALGDLTLSTGTVLLPKQQNLLFVDTRAQLLPSGADLASATSLQVLADDVRHATNLSLASTNGALDLQANSGIGTDPGATVSLSGVKGVRIADTVYAPGGTINVSLKGLDLVGTAPQLELGSTGFLSTRGTFVQKPSDKGLVQGTLWNGGSINLNAKAGTIALDAGSIVDVSGASQVVDQPAGLGATQPYKQVTQYANAGTLSITANDSVTLGGALRANASGTAAGGSFALTLSERGDLGDPTSGRRIVVSQNGTGQVAAVDGDKDLAISATKLTGSGFDKLRLTAEDQIVFADSTTLAFQRGVTLDSPSIRVADGANVLVAGSNVRLADSFGTRVLNNPGDPSDPHSTMQSTLPTPAQQTLAGSGTLSVSAGTVDVAGSVTLSGVASSTLAATGDLRLSGRVIGSASTAAGATLVGALTTAGDLTLKAAQVYPTTGSTFTVAVADGVTGAATPDGSLSIASSGGTRGNVYSAGGNLTLAADHIEQAGVVKAPLGTLNIKAGQDLTLAPNSITSVSSDGLTTLYGETQAGVTWTYGATGSDPLTTALTTLPSKHIVLDAPAVDIRNGATVDVSGGGDVAAVEFVQGSGGKNNALIQPNTYAIIPAANLSAMPIDPDIALANPLGFDKDSAVYNSIHIGPGGAVPAGDYMLLPGYYGLLKGGYVVQLLTGSTYANLQSGQTATLANGLKVVPGTLEAAGTNVAASNTIGVVVRPGSDISKLADYTVTTSSYFTALADKTRAVDPLLPIDGGQLSIAATQRLTLDGNLVANLPTAASRSAEVDIAANKIALVDSVGRGDIASDYLQIDSASLSRLDASLLIGGVRSTDSTGLVVTPQASDIIVANSAGQALQAPEVILAATDSITVRSGSLVEGSGTRPSAAQDFTIAGSGPTSGAVVRAANSALVQITRADTDTSKGRVTIESGATLSGSGSLTLAATNTTTSNGTLTVGAGGGLALISGTLSLGDTDGQTGLQAGLVLDNAQLAGFASLGTLSLKSYGGIDLYGNAQVGAAGLKNLVIDGGAFTGHASASGGAATAQFAAAQVTLKDSSGGTAATAAADANAGALSVNAGQITLGAGAKTVSGFSGVQLHSTGEILASGTGSLTAIGTLDIGAARIASTSGADQVWSARDGGGADAGYRAVNITAVAPAAALTDSTALGSRLEIDGSNIADSGQITMKAGAVRLQAFGTGAADGVQLNAGANIDAGGATRNFIGTIAVADAGQVTLAAAHGDVSIAQGAAVDVSASSAGGNAGTVSVQAQSFNLDGGLGGAAVAGTKGSFNLDLVNADPAKALDFSALNARLNAGTFNESRDIRVRNGDLAVAATDVVTAHHLALESDQGTVAVNGKLDASAAFGAGSVELYGANVSVASGAVIDASATATATGAGVKDATGGTVSLVASSGTLSFADGAVIDVRSGATGSAGSVLLRAPRTGNSLQAALAGQVLSQRRADSTAAEVDIEGNRVYGPDVTGSTITTDMIAGYGADNQAWMGAVDAAAVKSGLRGDQRALANVHVRPAVEVRAAGDLTIASPWDLTGSGWLIPTTGATTTEAGSLVVRAGGNLTLLSASLGNPDNGLPAAATWNIGLTSGADLVAANAARNQSTRQLATQAAAGTAGVGDLVLDSHDAEASVRTGTGNIRLSAGHDFTIKAGTDASTGDAVVGVVYTAGRAAIADPVTAPEDSRFAEGGGNVAISAQHDAIGVGNEWMTEWFRSATDADGGLDLGTWWAWRRTFHDGVAALGGGNVSIQAGQDILGLSAFAPTSAIKIDNTVETQKSPLLQTFGGGNISLQAGNDILGGQYLVSLGQGTLQAGGNIGSASQGVQLYLMGQGGALAASQADMKVVAGRSVAIHDIDNPATLYQSFSDSGDPSFGSVNSLKMLSYSSNSAATISALSGDVQLGNRPDSYLTLDPSQQSKVVRSGDLAAVYPARVAVTAFGGDIVNTGTAGGAILFPSANGSLKLLAGGNVTGMHDVVSDADPSLYGIQNLSETNGTNYYASLITNAASPNRLIANTSTDRFVDDVVALEGSVTDANFSFPQRSRVWAGEDIVNAALNLQNTAASDASEIIANTGSISRSPTSNAGFGGQGIGGPGSVLLQAGKNIEMGTLAFSSYGNQKNSALTDGTGATVTLLAGVTGTVDVTQLDKAFAALTAAGSSGDKKAAQDVIDALFKGAKIGRGDIDSFNTSIQSNAGADINVLAPGGNITVGLTTPSEGQTVGLLTTAGGAIRSYLSGDFDINQGKVVTAQGGDILIYTRDGSIDAGKGARTSSTTPPPTRTPILDKSGAVLGYTYKLPIAVTGSGIQTLTSKPGGPTSVAPKAGDIFLFAPSGTIDAGEAGIASGGAIFIVALTVLNADNITSVGASTGVPQVAVGSVESSLAASGATTSTGVTPGADAAAAAAAAAASNVSNFKPAILTVEVLGFGEKNCKETDKDCFAK
jgi:filamentous hemagglutinin family protein